VLAMDQYAYVLVDHLSGSTLVARPSDIGQALENRRIPVLAPYQWLREADPLPHSWDVTSDSIAAWVAGQVGASRLVLVKPPHAIGSLVDGYFHRALPAHVSSDCVPADRIHELRRLSSPGPAPSAPRPS
jgi:aspartokinase-like uncharacterized kinase